MQRAIVGLVCWLVGSVSGAAQDLVTGLEAAQAKIAAKQWQDALEILLPLQEAAKRDEDLAALARKLSAVSDGFTGNSEFASALRALSAQLAVRKRMYDDGDHREVAESLNNIASCQKSLGRADLALPLYEQSLAMLKRLHGDRDNPDVARSLNNVAGCQRSLGRAHRALPLFEQALEMLRRMSGDRDHREVAESLNNIAGCQEYLGRANLALPLYEQSLATLRRLYGDRDNPDVARSLNNVAGCQKSLGRAGLALPLFEQALEMLRRMHGGRDHRELAESLNHIAGCQESLGSANLALPLYEQSLAMLRRLYGDRDNPDVARSLTNVAGCQKSLGRADLALPLFEQSLMMLKRYYGDRDHPEILRSLREVASCQKALGRLDHALPLYEHSLMMLKRFFGDRDHPDVATSIDNVAHCHYSLGRADLALPLFEQSLGMWKHLSGDRDEPNTVMSLSNVASCLATQGRPEEAFALLEQATGMIERIRDQTRASPEGRQSMFDHLKRINAFEGLQILANRLGRPATAVHAAERSRGRALLDQLAQVGDPDAEAERRAQNRGDERTAARLLALREEIESLRTTSDRLLHELMKLADVADAAIREPRLATTRAQSNEVNGKLRRALDERARLLGDLLPVGVVRTPLEIQTVLQQDELLLEFTVTEDVAMLYVVTRDQVEAIDLPQALATVQRVVPGLLRVTSRTQLRGVDPEDGVAGPPQEDRRKLFASLIPTNVWERVRAAKRVFVAAHRELHRMPFELLVTDVQAGNPVLWIDNGPPIAYVPSGTMLHWLRKRSEQASNDATGLDLLAIGDPQPLDAEPEVPEQGAFVVAVNEGGEGARVGLRAGDVLTSYDDRPLTDDKALRDARMDLERAVEDKKRTDATVKLGVWRRGTTLALDVRPGLLGVQVGPGRARSAYEASLKNDAKLERILRAGDLQRLRKLPPLAGALAETGAIEQMFVDKKAKAKRLVGADATEPAVFDLAAKAKYLHFACHGITEEYAGQSLSMLVLSPPSRVLPGDDGLLKLGDLLNAWSGRLSSCRLVVLSACRTNVGPTLRDEAPQALPIGFLFAGAPTVVSSLWAVDDVSTKELMSDFYARLLAGGTDKLAAFTAAKKALRAKYPDPFHWAPFLYIGAPE